MGRRAFLSAGASLALLASWPGPALAGLLTARKHLLLAAPAKLPLLGAGKPATEVWTYNGQFPGPTLRVRQGKRLRVAVTNRLSQGTTVHWHGMRVPNPMDGVPRLTQDPIAPGATFLYEFDCPDAGTFFYHSHELTPEQVGRGLFGAVVVEEREPMAVDRDLVWVLSDLRLLADASIAPNFGNFHDAGHAGRIGNTVMLNGRMPEPMQVRAGERLRLRLVNAANARIFALRFDGHAPIVIASDGQPVDPHPPANEQIVLGPGMRCDIILDLTGQPEQRFAVHDTFYQGFGYRLLDLVYSPEPPVRAHPILAPARLADNPLPEPDLSQGVRYDIVVAGGMMGGMMGGGRGGMMGMMGGGAMWSINGAADIQEKHDQAPLLNLPRGQTTVLAMVNNTAFFHTMHLHGHYYRVLSRNEQPAPLQEWQDTTLIAPRERIEVAFVADNPGDWLFHCHMLEHEYSGLMATFRVA